MKITSLTAHPDSSQKITASDEEPEHNVSVHHRQKVKFLQPMDFFSDGILLLSRIPTNEKCREKLEITQTLQRPPNKANASVTYVKRFQQLSNVRIEYS